MAKRILLFTGKGGVGKTTCAAATALRAAEMGYRTLVLSSDPAHSLADALDRPLGPEPELVAPNLWAQEVDLYYSMKKYWGNMRELMLTVFRWQGVDAVAAEEMAALPGMNEGSVLLWLEQFHRSDDYDLIVVDSAPTGETLTLLTLPQATQWWVAKAFPFQKTAIKTAGFALRKTTGIPLDKGYDELNRLFDKLRAIQDVLANSDVSSIRLVMNPEKMVIEEAKRAYTYLQLYGYGVDAVVVNRVLPEEGTGTVFGPYVAAQKKYLKEIDESFAPLPIIRVPHGGREVFGLELLREIGHTLYGDGDPTALMYAGQTYRVTQEGSEYLLELRLPFAHDGEVTARHAGDQLVIQLANQRRNYLLPRFLAYYTLGETGVKNGWLRVRFAQAAA
ncbi:arsenite efflux ATP-binding protein ArsA [bacterium JGI 053]|nr:arsenite efflux ATP-binding protein ArsA [bacterium JGI 053]